MRILALLGISIIWLSCGSFTGDDSRNSIPEPEFFVPFNHASFPLAAFTDDGQFPGLSARPNDTFGRMELQDERGLSLFVMEDSTTCVSKKEEIESGIFQIEYVVDNERILAYKSSLPDGSESYHHLFASLLLNGTHYTLESDPLVSYNQSELRQLIDLVNSIRYHTPQSDNRISNGNL